MNAPGPPDPLLPDAPGWPVAIAAGLLAAGAALAYGGSLAGPFLYDDTSAIGLDPNFAPAYNDRAWALHEKGEDAKALPDAEKAVALTSQNARTLETRAEIYEKLGQRSKAIADYRAVLKLVPDEEASKRGLKRLGAKL